MAIEVDYVHNRSRDEKVLHDKPTCVQPGDGRQLSRSRTSPRARRIRNFGAIGYYAYTGRSDYHGAADAVDQAVQQPVAGSANYTLSQIKNDEPSQPISGHTLVPFPVAPDLGDEYGLAETDQRHRAVFNGIWQVGSASR